uniref:SCP domain-containing protein n=1 Tax=Strongyloides venezuelensis TaxID=75913 RepID=A0A0K0G211_STRVS
MFFNFLLLYIIFIISVLRVDVLLGQREHKIQSVETKEKSQKSRSFRDRIKNIFNRQTKKISSDRNKVKIFDKNNPPNKVDKKNKQRDSNLFKRKQNSRNRKKFRIEKYLKRHSFINIIWHYVWDSCKLIECYSQKNYSPLYGRFIEETNLYRRIHGSRPLQMDVQLTNLAVSKAKMSARRGKLISSPITDIGENSIFCSKYYAPLTVYMWYMESAKHNYKTFVALQNSIHFSNLVWKDARRIGIGIAERAGFLYIFFEFSPETNRRFRFRENVLKPRYHWYNYRSLLKM